VIESVLAHHERMAGRQLASPPPADPGPGYRPETLDILFGEGKW